MSEKFVGTDQLLRQEESREKRMLEDYTEAVKPLFVAEHIPLPPGRLELPKALLETAQKQIFEGNADAKDLLVSAAKRNVNGLESELDKIGGILLLVKAYDAMQMDAHDHSGILDLLSKAELLTEVLDEHPEIKAFQLIKIAKSYADVQEDASPVLEKIMDCLGQVEDTNTHSKRDILQRLIEAGFGLRAARGMIYTDGLEDYDFRVLLTSLAKSDDYHLVPALMGKLQTEASKLDVLTDLFEHGHYDTGLKIWGDVQEIPAYRLERFCSMLVAAGRGNDAEKLLPGITTDSGMYTVAEKYVARGEVDKAWTLLESVPHGVFYGQRLMQQMSARVGTEKPLSLIKDKSIEEQGRLLEGIILGLAEYGDVDERHKEFSAIPVLLDQIDDVDVRTDCYMRLARTASEVNESDLFTIAVDRILVVRGEASGIDPLSFIPMCIKAGRLDAAKQMVGELMPILEADEFVQAAPVEKVDIVFRLGQIQTDLGNQEHGRGLINQALEMYQSDENLEVPSDVRSYLLDSGQRELFVSLSNRGPDYVAEGMITDFSNLGDVEMARAVLAKNTARFNHYALQELSKLNFKKGNTDFATEIAMALDPETITSLVSDLINDRNIVGACRLANFVPDTNIGYLARNLSEGWLASFIAANTETEMAEVKELGNTVRETLLAWEPKVPLDLDHAEVLRGLALIKSMGCVLSYGEKIVDYHVRYGDERPDSVDTAEKALTESQMPADTTWESLVVLGVDDEIRKKLFKKFDTDGQLGLAKKYDQNSAYFLAQYLDELVAPEIVAMLQSEKLDTRNMVEDWKLASPDALTAYAMNLQSISRLEGASEGIAMRLHDGYNISNFARFPDEQWIAQDAFDGGNFGIVVGAKHDNSGALMRHIPVWKDYHVKMEAGPVHYTTLVVEARNKIGYVRRLVDLKQRFPDNKVGFVIADAHGSSTDKVWLGPGHKDFIGVDDLKSQTTQTLKADYYAKDMPFLFLACFSGKPDGLADQTAREFETVTFGPEVATGTKSITPVFDETRLVKFEAEYSDVGAEREYRG